MKKILLAAVASLSAVTMASAADFPVGPIPAKVALPVPVIFNWTGCYLGAEGGGNWGRSEHVAESGPDTGTTITGHFDLHGAMAGGTVGCQIQTSNFVFGIEDDISWTNKKGSAFDLPPFTTAATSTTSEKWIDTLRGRFGYVPWDRLMLYVTGGVAFADVDAIVANPAWGSITDSQNRIGWVAGVGAEWAAWVDTWGALTFKIEYLHADFDSEQYINPPFVTSVGTTVVTRDVRLTDDMVRVGANFKFNWGSPIVARY